MKIANIVYENELINHIDVEYINYINLSVEYKKIENNLPTLYVGWLFMKKSNQYDPDFQKIDILNNEIINNKLYWEYSFNENKAQHVKGVNNFVESIPLKYFTHNYDYEIIDPMFQQIKTVDDFINNLPEYFTNIYNYKNEMLYGLFNNKIYGIDIRMYGFFKFNVDELINIIKNKITNDGQIFDDLNGEIYHKYYNIFPNLIQLKRYIVVMLSK